MQYSLDNLTVSMYVNLATQLRSAGWNVYWHASGELEAHTSGLPAALGTVSLVQDIPANPTFISGLTDGDYTRQDKIILPAAALRVAPPRKIARLGLGDPRFEREVDIRIACIATDSRQQATLASMLYEWLEIGEDDRYLSVNDYDTDPSTPPALDPVEVWWSSMTTPEVATEVDTIRYQINIELILRFVE